MSLDDWHLVFVSICLALVLTACAPVVIALLPNGDEPFFALAVLGEEGMAEHYFPGDDPRIDLAEEIHWTIYIYNHMGESKYVGVKIKLQNSTTPAPNSTSCSPSPAPILYEIRRVLKNNETWLCPFSWSIEEAEFSGDFIELSMLTINNEVIEAHAIGLEASNFRLVLELWVYDEDFGDFRFDWRCRDELQCVWNQILFNVMLFE